MLQFNKEDLLQQKKNIDLLKIKYLNSKDKENISYVLNKISSFSMDDIKISATNIVSYSDVTNDLLDDMKIFGEDIYEKTNAILCSIPCYKKFNSVVSFYCKIFYSIDKNELKKNDILGVIKYFNIPKTFDNNSRIFLGSSYIHALKDTNYQEYIFSQTLGEVIPIFYELMQVESSTDMLERWLNIKLKLLLNEQLKYKQIQNYMKEHFKEKDLCKILQIKSGKYINGFYYALILYDEYKKNPREILNYIREVLNHEKTTQDVLLDLDVYEKKVNNVFDFQFDNICKVLK